MTETKSNYQKTHHASDIKSMVAGAHYAVFVNERRAEHDYYSKDNSPYMSPSLEYIGFEDEAALEAWVLDPSNASKIYKVVYIKPVEVQKYTTLIIQD